METVQRANGLGLMKQFPLQPGNQADLQRLWNNSASNWKTCRIFNRPTTQGFNFNSDRRPGFQIPPMPEDVPGKRGFNANIASSVTIADNTGRYTLKTNNGKKLFTAKDKNGDELFDGPVDNEKQRDALDRNLIKKLEQLEGMGNGQGGIQMRQFRFNGDRAIPRDLNFRFGKTRQWETGARKRPARNGPRHSEGSNLNSCGFLGVRSFNFNPTGTHVQIPLRKRNFNVVLAKFLVDSEVDIADEPAGLWAISGPRQFKIRAFARS